MNKMPIDANNMKTSLILGLQCKIKKAIPCFILNPILRLDLINKYSLN